jgi:hypothetical protein
LDARISCHGCCFKESFLRKRKVKCFFEFSENGKRLDVLGQEIGSINLRTDIVPMDDIEELTDRKDQRLIYAAYVPKIVKIFQQWLALMHLLPKFPEYDSEANAFQAFARLLVQDGSMVQDGIIRLPDLEDVV